MISERMPLKIMQFIHAIIILQIFLSGFIQDLATDWKKIPNLRISYSTQMMSDRENMSKRR